jgi:hypothetical protein
MESSKTIDAFKEKDSELSRQLSHSLSELSRAQLNLDASQSQLLDLKSKYGNSPFFI